MGTDCKHQQASDRLAELGHSTRLCIFRQLVRAKDKGLPVGQLQENLNIPASTLSHHISRMVKVGLITQTRSGSTLICTYDMEVRDCLISYLQAECC